MIKRKFQKRKNRTSWKIKNSNLGNIENIEKEIEKSNYLINSEINNKKIKIYNIKKENNEKNNTEKISNEKVNEIQKDKKVKLDSLIHKPVLLEEVIDGLDLKQGEKVFDGTLGQGGYSEEILKKIKKNGILIATDLDSEAIEFSKQRLKKYLSNKMFFQRNFSEIDEILKKIDLKKIDKAVLDLGFGSHQLDKSNRGISFLKDNEDLNMNLSTKKDNDRTASDILNYWEEETLADIFLAFGGEKHAKLVAKKIVEQRKEKPFLKVNDLTSLLVGVLGPFYRKQKIHPATRVFQALRIVVNDELNNLEKALEKIFNLLSNDGIIAVVTFHSLEDKIVKKFFRKKEDEGLAQRINKKVIKPTDIELKNNKRSRSAKLRILKKTPLNKNKYNNNN